MLAELYFNLPMFSAILLLIAGVLLGYALWFPFRGDTESITRRLNDLRDQNEELHSALRNNQQTYDNLEKKYSQQCDELTALRVSSKRVESALKEHDAAHSDISSGVATIKELKASAMKQLELEREARTALEIQLHEAQAAVNSSLSEQSEQRAQLESQLRDAQAQLTQMAQTAQHTRVTLDMELADRREQCEVLSEALEQSRSAHIAVNAELELVQQEFAALQSEQQERKQFEAQQQDADQLSAQLKTQTDDYRNLRSKYDMLVEQLDATKQNTQSLERERDHLRAAVNEKHESLLAAEKLITNTIASQDTVEEQLLTLQSELKHQREQYEALGVDRDDIAEQLKLQQEQNLELQTQIQEQINEIALRREAEETTRDIRDDLAAVRTELDQTRAQLQRTIAERDDAVAARDAATAARDTATGTVDSLRIDLAHHQRAIETIERHRSKTESALSSQASRQTELEQTAQQHEHTIETLREELAELTTLRNQCISLQTRMQDQSAQLKATRQDRDEIAAELAEGKNKWNSIEQRLVSYQRDLDRVREQREELLGQLSGEQARNQDLCGALEEQSRRLELVGQNLTQIEPLKDEIVSLRSQVERQQSEIAELTAKRDAALHRASEGDEVLQQTKHELSETRQSLIALERDRDEVLGRLRRQNVMLESHLAKGSLNDTEQHSESATGRTDNEWSQFTRRDERRGLVYTTAPTIVDDLKKISGIAAVLEQRLNEFGIYTYQQIMEWNGNVIAEFSKLLSFRDRIQRDDWIGQATALHQEKYDRAA